MATKWDFLCFHWSGKILQPEKFPAGYREENYLPEAVVNMLSFLGWNPGNRTGILYP
jgi:glutamyl-tRNA synthetase